jgi:hypothetical protein
LSNPLEATGELLTNLIKLVISRKNYIIMTDQELKELGPAQLLEYFEECVVKSQKSPEDVQALLLKERVKTHIVCELAMLVMLK